MTKFPLRLAIICPVYNEQKNIAYFFERLSKAVERIDRRDYTITLLFTNNRSSDDTLELIDELHRKHDWVEYLTLSRNHGYQLSVLSGLQSIDADLYMVCDVDCEDPPELLHDFLQGIEEGQDYVYGIRNNRPDPWLLGKMRKAFYFTLQSLGDYRIVPFMSEFAMFRRKVRDVLIRGNNSFPFLRAEVGYGGFKIHGIQYRREARKHGESHYNYIGNFRFAIAGILSSTTFPLRALFYSLPCVALAILATAAAFALNLFSFAAAMITLATVASLYTVFGVGLSAVYMARIYHNTLGRPRFVIDPEMTSLNTATRDDREFRHAA